MSKTSTEIEPVVLETTATLQISDSFYDDVAKDLGIDLSALAEEFSRFEGALKTPLLELEQMIGKILLPPKISGRGARPRPPKKLEAASEEE